MTRILVTGSAGFIGRNLVEALAARPETRVAGYDLGQPESDLERGLAEADAVFHLAGVNRPRDPGEFETGNCDFTRRVCGLLDKLGRRPLVVLSSSIQAELDNPYGVSKRHAEETLQAWAQAGAGQGPGAVVFRLKNVFGKWCRPNYNSVTATFCHNIARGLPVTISDPARELDLVYVDDVVAAFIAAMDARLAGQTPAFLSPGGPGWWIGAVERSFKITLGELEARIQSFRKTRQTLVAPALGRPADPALVRHLPELPGRTGAGLQPAPVGRRPGGAGRVHQSARVWADFRLAHAAGDHPRASLSPHQERKIPGP